jgi:hypothetical protein
MDKHPQKWVYAYYVEDNPVATSEEYVSTLTMFKVLQY